MLTTILDILSIIGIILLVILICAVIILALVLFLPIVYRSKGYKQANKVEVWAKARWLFGFITVFYAYPNPNTVVIKCLGFELYNSSKSSLKGKQEDDSAQREHAKQNNSDTKSGADGTTPQAVDQQDDSQPKVESKNIENNAQAKPQHPNVQAGETIDEPSKNIIERIKITWQKIKYTILGIYDKIKHIVQNIAYYKNVFQEEETKQLFQHVIFRVKKIWKNIHPRKIKANIHFGTGSPDTTGYLCGVYGMFCSYLGNSVIVQADFEQQILEGDFYIAGHITVFQLLFHGAAIILDKNLHLFWNKIKQGGNSKNGR